MTISQTKLFELLNAQVQPPVPFTPVNVQLVNPVANAGVSWNTRLTMQAVPNRGFVNDALVYYYRVDLADLGTQEFQLSEIASAAALVAALNTRLNAWLDVSDLEAFTIPANEGTDENLTLTAVPGSLGWVGSMPIVLKALAVTMSTQSTDPYENGSGFVISTVFTLSSPAASDVTFDVTTESDTALEDIHFVPKTESVTIPQGQTTASFDTEIVFDCVVAPGDQFKLNVANITGLLDDNDLVLNVPVRASWTILDGRVVINDEGVRVARFQTFLAPLSSVAQSVNWQTLASSINGTPAIPGTDFTADDDTITHAPEQQSGLLYVMVRPDDPAEDKKLAVMLAGQGTDTGMTRNIGQAEILIQQPILSVSDGVLRPAENPGLGDREMVFTISLNQDGPVTFDYMTAQPGFTSYNDYGTAVKDVDYIEAMGFSNQLGGGNPTSMEIIVQIDTAREDNPYFFLELSNVSGARCERYRGKGVITAASLEVAVADATFELIPPGAAIEDGYVAPITLLITQAVFQENSEGSYRTILNGGEFFGLYPDNTIDVTLDQAPELNGWVELQGLRPGQTAWTLGHKVVRTDGTVDTAIQLSDNYWSNPVAGHEGPSTGLSAPATLKYRAMRYDADGTLQAMSPEFTIMVSHNPIEY